MQVADVSAGSVFISWRVASEGGQPVREFELQQVQRAAVGGRPAAESKRKEGKHSQAQDKDAAVARTTLYRGAARSFTVSALDLSPSSNIQYAFRVRARNDAVSLCCAAVLMMRRAGASGRKIG